MAVRQQNTSILTAISVWRTEHNGGPHPQSTQIDCPGSWEEITSCLGRIGGLDLLQLLGLIGTSQVRLAIRLSKKRLMQDILFILSKYCNVLSMRVYPNIKL